MTEIKEKGLWFAVPALSSEWVMTSWCTNFTSISVIISTDWQIFYCSHVPGYLCPEQLRIITNLQQAIPFIINCIIQLHQQNDKTEAVNLVKSYVMSDDMQINSKYDFTKLEDAVDNKGVLLVGNYGTGKSHLMSVISSIALDKDSLEHVNNKNLPIQK